MNENLIGYDATPLEAVQWSGVGQYTAQLLAALIARGDQRRYALLAGRRLNGHVPPGTLGQIGPLLPNRSAWMQIVLPRILARLRPAVCHFTNSIAPLFSPCPYVVTLHDMSLFLYAHTHPTKSLLVARSIIPSAAHRAQAIITVSHSARRDIIAVLKVPPEKVHVVYEAARPEYQVMPDTVVIEGVRRKYDLHAPFVLYVGTIEPRKNLGRLIQAFAQMRRRGRREHLLLVGQLGWKYGAMLRQIEALGLTDSVRLLGYVPDADLPALYNMARVFIFPSLYEGFGLPVVESMACGTPVITSNRSSLAEVGGNASLLVDPTRPEDMTDGLLRVLTDADLHDHLRAAGLARAAQFSWTRAADETTRIYETCSA